MLRLSPFENLKPFSLLVLFIGILAAALLLSSLLGILLVLVIWGPDMLSIIGDTSQYANPAVIAALKMLQIINQVFGLLLPAILFILLARLITANALSLNDKKAGLLILLSAAFILTAQPVIGWLGDLNSRMELPAFLSQLEEWFAVREKQAGLLTEAFLATTTATGLLVNILMIAILPALAEEAVFRGALQPVLSKLFRNQHFGIFAAAILFSAIHLQFYGFLPRLALGVAFGYLYLWTGNLWAPVTAHFVNNLLSVIAEFLFRKGLTDVNAAELGNTGNALIIIPCVVGCGLMLTWFYKNKTNV